MKYLELILVILATVFIYQIEAIPKPSESLNYLGETVNGTLEFVSGYENQLAVDGDKIFDELFDHEKEAISTNGDYAYDVILEKIREADIEASLAQKCYRVAESGFFEARRLIASSLDRCFTLNSPNWSDFHEKIGVQINNGETLLNRFTGMRENCTSELVNEELCIALQLPDATLLVALYEANVTKLKAEVALATVNGVEDIAVCLDLPLRYFKLDIERVVFNVEECIKSA